MSSDSADNRFCVTFWKNARKFVKGWTPPRCASLVSSKPSPLLPGATASRHPGCDWSAAETQPIRGQRVAHHLTHGFPPSLLIFDRSSSDWRCGQVGSTRDVRVLCLAGDTRDEPREGRRACLPQRREAHVKFDRKQQPRFRFAGFEFIVSK